jgi:amidophosphoribosyltransferase
MWDDEGVLSRHDSSDPGAVGARPAATGPLPGSEPMRKGAEIVGRADATQDETPGHACGVFGVYGPGQSVSHLTYLGLFALQHRGQESAGIAVSDGETITVAKDMGLVTQVFDERRLAPLQGHLAIGHNGNLTNTAELAAGLGMLPGMTPDETSFDSTTDSALIAELVAREWPDEPRSDGKELELALEKVLPALQGGFSLVLMDDSHLIGVRDPHGFWPLVLGRLEGGGWVLASETAALDIVGAHYVRDVQPGEMVVIDASGLRREHRYAEPDPTLCLFEFVYFARPDTRLYGQSVHAARTRMGVALADQAPVQADMVMPVPESGIPAAQGYARASGVPYGDGLVKNRYVGRTFIQPSQQMRGAGVRMKLNPLPEAIKGKRLVVVDDSIVRGTTTREVIKMLREAGASEVHFRVSSPPYRWPCFYGMDTGRRGELLAADLSVGEIREYLDVDSLAYLELDRLRTATGAPPESFCTACLSKEYPVPVALTGADSKLLLEAPVLDLTETGASPSP